MSKGRGVLYFATAFRLVGIDPEKMRIRVKERTVPPPLPARKFLDYLDAGLPHCAGYAVHGSKLYMIGGNWIRKDGLDDPLRVPSNRVVDFPDGEAGITSNVYVADITSNSMEFEFSPICKMHGPKIKPMVLEVEGKLYVLSNLFGYLPESYDSPTFEVYDPKTNTVEALPDPPFYKAKAKGKAMINKWFVVGGKIYVIADDLFYSYKMNTRQWRISVTYVGAIESITWGFFVPGYDDVVIKFREDGSLLASLISPSSTRIRIQQVLELEDALDGIREDEMYLEWGNAAFVEMGEFKVGAIVPGSDMADNLIVFIFTFVLSKVRLPRKIPPYSKNWPKFLSLNCLNKGIYNLGPMRSFHEDVIVDAFFVEGSS